MKVVAINKSAPVYRHASLDFTNHKIVVNSDNRSDLNLSKEHEKIIMLMGKQYKILIPAGYRLPNNFEAQVAMRDEKPIIDLSKVLVKVPVTHSIFDMDHNYLSKRYSGEVNSFFKKDKPYSSFKKNISSVGLDGLSRLIAALASGQKGFVISDKDMAAQEAWAYTAKELSDEMHDVMYYQLPVPNMEGDYFEFVYYKRKNPGSHKIVMLFDDFSIEVNKIKDDLSIIFYSDMDSGSEALEYLRKRLEKETVKLDMARFVNSIYKHKIKSNFHTVDGYV